MLCHFSSKVDSLSHRGSKTLTPLHQVLCGHKLVVSPELVIPELEPKYCHVKPNRLSGASLRCILETIICGLKLVALQSLEPQRTYFGCLALNLWP